jgi:hypothetical protein
MPKKSDTPVINQTVIGDGNVQIAGDHNTVNQTFIQKIFQFFAGDAETTEQRNRRIMLGHVENFWVKGILEKSLYGAALLDLGIKEEPDAVKTYPWAIKRESTQEILPAGIPMLEIFQTIGLGRSLLVLGAPGSGKTTMLLELTRQLIERARQDATEPIPTVFNLSSWTEKLTLADWLAKELNIIYYVPKRVAPTWVKENKILLLLDGLDEVKQESRAKCVEAINQFREENGLTSMAVCSRILDYAELKTRLSFDGAIEIQPLTAHQVDEYFEHSGIGLAGINQALQKDTVLREMAETPLFLSIMALAYRNTQSKEILVSGNEDAQRWHLFETYIQQMFERIVRTKSRIFEQDKTILWLSWLSLEMIKQGKSIFLLETIEQNWLPTKDEQWLYKVIRILGGGLCCGLVNGLAGGLIMGVFVGLIGGFKIGLFYAGTSVVLGTVFSTNNEEFYYEKPIALKWSWKMGILGLLLGLLLGAIGQLLGWEGSTISSGFMGLFLGLVNGFYRVEMERTLPNQSIRQNLKNIFVVWVSFLILSILLSIGIIGSQVLEPRLTIFICLLFGLSSAIPFVFVLGGGQQFISHYTLRILMHRNDFMPWKYIPFLDYCTNLIFLRRVGGGYIFVHRLLMEHFAAMYAEPE